MRNKEVQKLTYMPKCINSYPHKCISTEKFVDYVPVTFVFMSYISKPKQCYEETE